MARRTGATHETGPDPSGRGEGPDGERATGRLGAAHALTRPADAPYEAKVRMLAIEAERDEGAVDFEADHRCASVRPARSGRR